MASPLNRAGQCEFQSEPGKGTRVELWLPRANEDHVSAAAHVQAEARSDMNGQQAAGHRLLLVDDHEEVRATTAILLKDLGHQVTEAAAGVEVLDRLRADPSGYDCVVSDYAMPDISGAEVVRQARTIRHALPALLITGYANADFISTLPSDVKVLTKPFSPEDLNHAIFAAIKAAGDEV